MIMNETSSLLILTLSLYVSHRERSEHRRQRLEALHDQIETASTRKELSHELVASTPALEKALRLQASRGNLNRVRALIAEGANFKSMSSAEGAKFRGGLRLTNGETAFSLACRHPEGGTELGLDLDFEIRLDLDLDLDLET